MKKILFLFSIITLIIVSTTGCSTNKKNSFLFTKNLEEKPLSYKIEKIVLSKGFQSIEPNTEIINKGNNLKILVTVGLIECSGVTIDKITQSGNDINIYIERLLEKGKTQLSIPQIMISIDEPTIEKLDKLNYNIINQNYETITLKFNKNQILNKICSQYNISPNTMPIVNLIKRNNQLLWDISFNNIFDKKNYKSPIINFHVKVDANTGKILDSKKENISTYIDNGTILDYVPSNHLLYKQQIEDEDNIYEKLWYYNTENGEKKKLYTSKGKIQSAIFNPNAEYISLIELNDDKTDLYVINILDGTAYKITAVDCIYTNLMKWINENTLLFIDNSGSKSTLLRYDLEKNNTTVQFNLDISVEDFDALGDNFLFIKNNEDESLNKTIYFKKKGTELKELAQGFKANFFNENYVVYLKNIEKEDKNILHVYDIEKQQEVNNLLDYDIGNYFKLDEENLMLIEKNNGHNNFALNKYNIANGHITPIADINSSKIFFDPYNERCYISLTPPDDIEKDNIIYSVNMSNLNIIDNKN
ncbi:hypothetical protein EDD65_101133 [Keratinibaculum paraultunense]|uniref:Uncharacterized protein n=1 Tax=Keratinibaculum paraultunense TaxID=1278232 RepID=A0A4V2UUM9_9FIRM|nr:hypothetical protein [Keratinibaculum paraultunense]QQY80049.1 hypothetical protein JL105_01560 [Keratinibaculum paraultunense]TCS91630.1 hypothetical protein EDD65_101133 [Keratinibaculum paraultunense]